MKKTRKVLSLLTALAISASAFAGLTVSASADEVSEPDGSRATFTVAASDAERTAYAVKATYADDGRLTGVKTEGVTIAAGQTTVVIPADEGTTVLLWNDLKNPDPLAPAAEASKPQAEATPTPNVTEPTDAPTPTPTADVTEPTEAPTPTPTVAPTPAALGVYIDENFDSYDAGEIIRSAGNNVDNAPDPVTYGKIEYRAGRRNNGSINDYANFQAAGEGKEFYVSADGYATSGRGISTAFTDEAQIPDASVLPDGAVLELSMKVKANQTFTVSGYGDVTAADLTTSADYVNLRIGLDKTAGKQYQIVTDASGNILSTKVANLTASSLTGLTFYVANGAYNIDDLKVEVKTADVGYINVSVKDASDAAVGNVNIALGTLSVSTAADGTLLIAVPNGEYSLSASKLGYEHTKGMQDIDSASVTVNSAVVDAAFTLSIMSYDKIPETVTIDGGQSFIAAPKTSEPNKTEAFTVSVLDQMEIAVEPDEYTLTWAIYPAGTKTADSNVTIDEDGVVSVSQGFSTDNNIAGYDVTATAVMNNEGLRGQTVTKTLYVGNNDVIYYEPIAWERGDGDRNATTKLVSAVTLPDISSIELNLKFGTLGGDTTSHRTIGLITSGGPLVGLQYQKSGTIKVWTVPSFSANWDQYSDLDKFTNSADLVTDYTAGTNITVSFAVDITNKNVTATCGETSVSLPITITPGSLTGLQTGMYRNNGSITVNSVAVVEPDANYLAIAGDLDFAKVSEQTVERNYVLGQSVIVPDEAFTWAVSPADSGVTIDNDGKLSVADTAAAGAYTITAASSINAEKTATANLTLGDFQTITAANATVEGPRAYAGIGETAKYEITKLIDSFGDDVTKLFPAAVWASSNEDVATIDSSTGELTTVAAGSTTVTATITNGTATTTLTVPVTVAQYSITLDAAGASTAVDTSALVSDSAIKGYQVTTSNGGKLVKQETVTEAPSSVDTTGADKLEIAPIFTYSDITKANSITAALPADTYNFVISGASGAHFDPYANSQMLANNMLQGGSTVNSIEVNDIIVNEGYLTLHLEDAANDSKAGTITVVKAPSIVDRVRKIYVLGDSLVCIYANGGSAENSSYQTGWGQVLQSYVKDAEVVDLGNSGVTSVGLASSAITQPVTSGKAGDILLLESGYNDRSYVTKDEMTEAVTAMYNDATAKGLDVILISPNASAHDYKADVSWTGTMMSIADDLGAKKIDLAELSYDFLFGLYGDNGDNVRINFNVSDRLHSTYNGAQKWASVIASELIGLRYGDIINTEYSYSFQDTLGNTITCKAIGPAAPAAD